MLGTGALGQLVCAAAELQKDMRNVDPLRIPGSAARAVSLEFLRAFTQDGNRVPFVCLTTSAISARVAPRCIAAMTKGATWTAQRRRSLASAADPTVHLLACPPRRVLRCPSPDQANGPLCLSGVHSPR